MKIHELVVPVNRFTDLELEDARAIVTPATDPDEYERGDIVLIVRAKTAPDEEGRWLLTRQVTEIWPDTYEGIESGYALLHLTSVEFAVKPT